jgi:hypothetical protein
MSNPKYHSMNFCNVPIFVQNRQTYKNTFVRATIGDDKQEVFEENECSEMHLYKVLLPDDTTKFVLACDGSSAIGQATCGYKFEVLILEKAEFEKRCFALRVPLRIQGWGSEEV